MIDRRYVTYFDWGLLALTFILGLFGLMTLYSAVMAGVPTPQKALFVKQLIWYGIGLAAMQMRRIDPDAIIRNLGELEIDAPVVHEDHGVGRYQGLQTMEIDDRPAEFLTIAYADGDRLYVPVSHLHLVSRYTGSDPEAAPLHRLGGKQWETARKKAARQVRDVAAELLDLYARRLAREGFAFPLDERLYAEFASGFPFEETPDQQRAIDAVIADLTSPRVDPAGADELGEQPREIGRRDVSSGGDLGRRSQAVGRVG